ncbi:Vacuolar protein sorting-associated protein, partial [Pseudoloma neurophilia]
QESFNDINQKNVNENSKDQIKDQESFNDINQKNVNENSKDQIKDQESFNDINQKNVNENSKDQIKDVNENSKDQIKDVNENSKDQIKDVNENSKDQIKEVNNFTAALNSIHLNKFDNQIIQSDDVEKSEKIIDFMFFTIHEFEINLEDEVITRLVDWIPKKKEESLLLFYLLHIGPIKMRLSLNMSKKKKILERMASFFVSNLSEVRLSFKSLIFTQFGFNTELIINAYKMQILSQIFRIIGGLDFLGNISSLVEELSFGVHDLFNEPYNGFKQDDLLLFTTGILKGGKNFTTYFLKGITNTVSKIGKSISKSSSKRVILFYEPLEVDVSKDFLENVVDGISGIITKPVQGAKKKGIKGFFKGIGSGITGALSKPIAGVSEIAANINEDLKFTLEGIELKRIRYPRPRLEIFSLERCQAYYLFQIFKYKHLQPIRPVSTRTSIKDEEFIDGEIGTILDVRVHLILTTKRLVLISREANIHINEFIFVSNGVKAEQWIIHTSREFLSRIKDNFFNLSAQEDNHISLDQ